MVIRYVIRTFAAVTLGGAAVGFTGAWADASAEIFRGSWYEHPAYKATHHEDDSAPAASRSETLVELVLVPSDEVEAEMATTSRDSDEAGVDELVLGGGISVPASGLRNYLVSQGGGERRSSRGDGSAPSRNISVAERPRPSFDPKGVRVSSFMFLPTVTTEFEFNDNIFATEFDEQGDVIMTISPKIDIQSQWSRHSLAAGAYTDYAHYFDIDDESNINYGFFADGELEVLRTTTASAGFRYDVEHEARSSSSSAGGTIEPTEFDKLTAYAAASQELNRLRFAGRFEVQTYDYDDGVTRTGMVVDQDDRDRYVLAAGLRNEYAVSPDTSVFVDLGWNERSYDLQPPTVPLDRDSWGYEILFGTNFDFSRLVRGELAVGYTSQHFEGATLSNLNGVTARGGVEWFPTGLTTVGFDISREVSDSGVPGSGGIFATNTNLHVDHELLRNLVVNGGIGFLLEEFDGVDRDDTNYNLTTGVKYLLNRNAEVGASYRFEKRRSSGALAGADHQINSVFLSATLKL